MMNAAFEHVYEPCRRAYEGAVGKRRACVRACEDEKSELQPEQGDAARGSCRVARAVESGLRRRSLCVCTWAVAHRAGGEQSAAHPSGQEEILAGGDQGGDTQFSRVNAHRQLSVPGPGRFSS